MPSIALSVSGFRKWSLHPALFLLVFLLAAVMSSAAQFTGVSLKVADATVPPAGTLQYQISVTEPKPILKGQQRVTFSATATQIPLLGQVQSGAMFSPSGDVSGVTVLSKGSAQLFFSSPLTSFGTSIDFPVVVLSLPVSSTAVAGKRTKLNLDPNVALWFDPNAQLYPVELTSGTMTVGGTMSISKIVPGAGVVPAGTPISIHGIGFQPTAQVDINEAKIATVQYISPNEIDVTLSQDFDMETRRVRVTEPTTNERITYYSYQQTTAGSKSTHPLIASSLPMFSHSTWTLAYLKPVAQGTTFTGVALQNLNSTTVTGQLTLFDSAGKLLGTKSVSLKTNTRIARDLAELFPGFTIDGTTLQITAATPIQVLGLLGDDAAGTVTPVEATATP